jgi:hypothetical protein
MRIFRNSVAEARFLHAPRSRPFPQLDQAARKAGPIIRMIIFSMILAEIWADRKSVMDAVITGFSVGKEGDFSNAGTLVGKPGSVYLPV